MADAPAAEVPAEGALAEEAPPAEAEAPAAPEPPKKAEPVSQIDQHFVEFYLLFKKILQ